MLQGSLRLAERPLHLIAEAQAQRLAREAPPVDLAAARRRLLLGFFF